MEKTNLKMTSHEMRMMRHLLTYSEDGERLISDELITEYDL